MESKAISFNVEDIFIALCWVLFKRWLSSSIAIDDQKEREKTKQKHATQLFKYYRSKPVKSK